VIEFTVVPAMIIHKLLSQAWLSKTKLRMICVTIVGAVSIRKTNYSAVIRLNDGSSAVGDASEKLERRTPA